MPTRRVLQHQRLLAPLRPTHASVQTQPVSQSTQPRDSVSVPCDAAPGVRVGSRGTYGRTCTGVRFQKLKGVRAASCVLVRVQVHFGRLCRRTREGQKRQIHKQYKFLVHKVTI